LSRYVNLSVTADGTTLVTTVESWQSVITIREAGEWKRITAGAGREDGAQGLTWSATGRIAYTSRVSGSLQIWSMKPDGRDRRQLTHVGTSRYPSASPDGRQIAFVSRRDDRSNIWRMREDGSEQKMLSNVEFSNFPAWSVDGKWIMYLSPGDNWRTYIVPADGGTATPLLEFWGNVTMSPDGRWIGGVSLDESGTAHLAVMPYPPKVTPRRLGPTPSWFGSVRWTPDGRALAAVGRANNAWNILRYPIDGSAPSPLTQFDSEQIFAFAWSQDGRQLACARGTTATDVVRITGLKRATGQP
jgi:TolB protein